MCAIYINNYCRPVFHESWIFVRHDWKHVDCSTRRNLIMNPDMIHVIMVINTFHGSDWMAVKSYFIFSVITLSWMFPAEIDHCADGKHGCEQEFMNTEASCVCKCRNGFTLRPDGKTCQSESMLIHSHKYLVTCSQRIWCVHSDTLIWWDTTE